MRVPLPAGDQPQEHGEQPDPEQLRAERQRGRPEREGDKREDRRGPHRRSPFHRGGRDQAERPRDQCRAHDREQLPATGAVQQREQDLGEPLLVEPG